MSRTIKAKVNPLEEKAKQAVKPLYFGLGNFGYPRSRHSVGLFSLDKVVKFYNLDWKLSLSNMSWTVETKDWILVMPRTYLVQDNLKALKKVMQIYDTDSDALTIVHHAMDAHPGECYSRFIAPLGPNPHLDPIAEFLDTKTFRRFGIGIAPRFRDQFALTYPRNFVMKEEDIRMLYFYNTIPQNHKALMDKFLFSDMQSFTWSLFDRNAEVYRKLDQPNQ